MSSYGVFAAYYDGLTRNVGYAQRCDRLCELLDKYGAKPKLVLDLACGTGSMTLELARRGFEPIGVDGSPEMLAEAQQKAAEAGVNILFLCQKMQKLDLYGTIEAAFCTLDSINHMTRPADVQETFRRVSLFLEPGGLFLFDVNTPYKHKYILGNETIVMETKQVFCVWQNELQPDERTVQIQLDFFARQGRMYSRSSERFRERAYTEEELKAWLEEAGLEVLEYCDAHTLCSPAPDCERWLWAARKPKAE
ncbi:MAG: methyltransferase domain-containing protein [Clostridia bacterium]|nr:methyltransferase domain-containing protein [Clostridia bacterium]